MQLMAEKGLTCCATKSQVKSIFIVRVSEEYKTKDLLLDRFVDSLFNERVASVAPHAAFCWITKRLRRRRLDEIRLLLEKIEKRSKKIIPNHATLFHKYPLIRMTRPGPFAGHSFILSGKGC